MAWAPGRRDTAISGLAALLNAQQWRDSGAGTAIATVVSAALHDTNPVVRMQAARAARALHVDENAAARAAKLGELLLAESDPNVRTVLLDQLAADIADAPTTIDAILEQLIDGEPGYEVIRVLTHLALVPQTRFASGLIEGWCTHAPTYPQAVQAFAGHARGYLMHAGSAAQAAAFRLLSVAAVAAQARWTQDPSEHRADAALSDDQRTHLRGAADVADSVAQQIYFASGAFDGKKGGDAPGAGGLAGFADLAFPVVATCAALRLPHCTHKTVETMIFLAPLDEARALQAVANAIPADGFYAGESLAGDLIIPYLERLLVEHRHLVLHDDHGVAAFGHLLATFATVGNQAALGLAYNFADVFR